MGVRSVRFHDLLAVHRIEMNRGAHVLWPAPFDAAHAATHLALASAWQDVNQTLFTHVLREKGELIGLAQAVARPGHDAWDLIRLALSPADPEDRERAADELLESLLTATGGRGGLRTFVRASLGGEAQALLTRRGFRVYATEHVLLSETFDPAPAPLPEHLEFRARRPADAWGIFQLYCSVAPAQVRHAEGLSSKRWTYGSPLVHGLFGRWLPVREVVLSDEGLIVAWARLTRLKGYAAQQLEIMLHPRADGFLPALLAHVAVALRARLDYRTLCRVRAYESAILTGLLDAGFDIAADQALLVKHAAARVTERQLLIEALRAQSLGIDMSQATVSAPPNRQPASFHSTPTEYTHND